MSLKEMRRRQKKKIALFLERYGLKGQVKDAFEKPIEPIKLPDREFIDNFFKELEEWNEWYVPSKEMQGLLRYIRPNKITRSTADEFRMLQEHRNKLSWKEWRRIMGISEDPTLRQGELDNIVTPQTLVDRIEGYDFECICGPITKCPEWIALKKRIKNLQQTASEHFRAQAVELLRERPTMGTPYSPPTLAQMEWQRKVLQFLEKVLQFLELEDERQ